MCADRDFGFDSVKVGCPCSQPADDATDPRRAPPPLLVRDADVRQAAQALHRLLWIDQERTFPTATDDRNAMTDYTHKRIDEMEAIVSGAFKRARAELGVTSFGMQVIDLPGGIDRYPEHDHAQTGQEEVYITLDGSGSLEVEGDVVALDNESMVRVGPESRRKVLAGPDGLRLLVLGGVPGGVYEAPEVSELGAADPFS